MKNEGGGPKNLFSVLLFNVTTKGFLSDLAHNWTVRAHHTPKQKVFGMYFQNLSENRYVIDHFCKISSCDASAMITPPPYIEKYIKLYENHKNNISGGTLSRITESGSHS